MRWGLTSLVSALLAATLPSQVITDDTWLFAASRDFILQNKGKGGGLWTLSKDRKRFKPVDLSGTGTLQKSLVWANAVAFDRARRVYVGTLQTSSMGDPNGSNVYRMQIVADRAVAAQRLTTGSPGGSFSQLVVVRDRLWFVTDGGGSARAIVGWIPLTGTGLQKPVVVHRVTTEFRGLGQSIASNGREVFIGSSYNSQDQFNLWVLDPLAAKPKLRGVALASQSRGAWPPQLSLGAGGRIWVFQTSGWIAEVDPVTGAVKTHNPRTARRRESTGRR